ncbi:MAG: gamma-glutamyltransferase [Acetobacteraceae bacterium]|nr:gamma-glutamyltransferase [Acetobacteraceae bacterium]
MSATPRLLLAFGRDAEPWLDFDPTRSRPARGTLAAATANPLASWAAVSTLRHGGAAIDAAIAAQAVLAVVEPNASGLGGGAVVLAATGAPFEVFAFDGLSAAPGRVPASLVRDFDGRAVPADRAVVGGRTVAVPGLLRALETAHARLGRLPWRALLQPAIDLAENGFPVAPYLRRALQEMPAVRDEALTRALFCDDEGAPLPDGALVRNPALARTLRLLADGGADAFYLGETAAALCEAVAADWFAGTLTRADLAAYRAVERAPVTFALSARSGPALTVATAALPAFGGIAAGQIVGIAARAGVAGLGTGMTEDEAHILAEAGRMAFADRAAYAADPDFVASDIRALLAPCYLDTRAASLDPARRTEALEAGDAADPDGASMTSHVVTADAAGGVVSMTTTINQNFGARIAVDGLYLNNALTNFAARPRPGHPGARNAMAPGKRPRTSIAPCIVFDAAGRPCAALGAGGGNRIPGAIANALLRLAGGLRDPQSLLAAPHALNWSGATEIEPPLERHGAGLARRGHWVLCRRIDIGAQAMVRDGGAWLAGGDPRRDGVGMACGLENHAAVCGCA